MAKIITEVVAPIKKLILLKKNRPKKIMNGFKNKSITYKPIPMKKAIMKSIILDFYIVFILRITF